MDVRFKDLEDSSQFDKTVRGKIVRLGREDEKQPYEILYVSEQLAVNNLLHDIHLHIDSVKWNWVKSPVIEKFQMTEQLTGQIVHRTVVPRYAGYCEIEVAE